MPKLITDANIEHADDFYQHLTDMSLGLDDASIASVNAKLILLLSNHIGDIDILKEAIDIAKYQEED